MRLPEGPEERPGHEHDLARPHKDDLAPAPKTVRHMHIAIDERLATTQARRRPEGAGRSPARGGRKLK